MINFGTFYMLLSILIQSLDFELFKLVVRNCYGNVFINILKHVQFAGFYLKFGHLLVLFVIRRLTLLNLTACHNNYIIPYIPVSFLQIIFYSLMFQILHFAINKDQI